MTGTFTPEHGSATYKAQIKKVAGGTASLFDYNGADPTGNNDNHSLIMQAITENDSLFVPLGVWRSDKCLKIRKTIHMYGEIGLNGTIGSQLKFPADCTGIFVMNGNTDCDDYGQNVVVVEENLGGGNYSIFERLWIQTNAGPLYPPDPGIGHGFHASTRFVLRDSYISGFDYNGINVVASGASEGADRGNANNWHVDHCVVTRCWNGIYVDGADANIGNCYHLSCSTNNNWGIYDSSFLGNTYVGCHCASNHGGEYATDSDNGKNVFVGCYAEENGNHPNSIIYPSIIVGGLLNAGTGNAPQLSEYIGPPSVNLTDPTYQMKVAINQEPNLDSFLSVLRNDVDTRPWRWRMEDTGDLTLDFANDAGKQPYRITGADTDQTFGRSAAVPYALWPKGGLFVGKTIPRYLGSSSAMPTTGEYAKGDFISNTNTAELGTVLSKYILHGWKRAVTGTEHVLNVDWFECRTLTGN